MRDEVRCNGDWTATPAYVGLLRVVNGLGACGYPRMFSVVGSLRGFSDGADNDTPSVSDTPCRSRRLRAVALSSVPGDSGGVLSRLFDDTMGKLIYTRPGTYI
ncbi:hypothetical protein Q7P36_010448 [Cladosporium allicinum]